MPPAKKTGSVGEAIVAYMRRVQRPVSVAEVHAAVSLSWKKKFHRQAFAATWRRTLRGSS